MRALRFNETKITIKYPLHRDNVVTEANPELNNDKNHILGISADFNL